MSLDFNSYNTLVSYVSKKKVIFLDWKEREKMLVFSVFHIEKYIFNKNLT